MNFFQYFTKNWKTFVRWRLLNDKLKKKRNPKMDLKWTKKD